MRRPIILCAGTLLLGTWPLMAGAVPDATGAVTSTPAPDISADAAMSARLNYNLGYEEFEKAQKASGKAALAGFSEARTRFEKAVAADPNLKEGWNLIGYTSRRLGEYERALTAYDKALALDAAYSEAIEYRAEACLALNRLDEVRAAYLKLFAAAPAQADVLMKSMQAWVSEKRRSPAGVSATELDAFAAWVEERAGLAQKTAALRPGGAVAQGWR